MSKLRLYYNNFSQPSRAVKCFLKLGKVDFEERFINLGKKENFSEEVKSLNWNCQVPFIVDGDFTVFESHTVMRYIHAKYKLDPSYYPSSLKERTLTDMYLDWHHSNTRKVAHYVATSLLSKRTKQPTIYVEEGIKKDLDLALFNLNAHLLNYPSHFLNGFEKPTIADLSCYFELTELVLIQQSYKDLPNIEAFMKKMAEIP